MLGALKQTPVVGDNIFCRPLCARSEPEEWVSKSARWELGWTFCGFVLAGAKFCVIMQAKIIINSYNRPTDFLPSSMASQLSLTPILMLQQWLSSFLCGASPWYLSPQSFSRKPSPHQVLLQTMTPLSLAEWGYQSTLSSTCPGPTLNWWRRGHWGFSVCLGLGCRGFGCRPGRVGSAGQCEWAFWPRGIASAGRRSTPWQQGAGHPRRSQASPPTAAWRTWNRRAGLSRPVVWRGHNLQ